MLMHFFVSAQSEYFHPSASTNNAEYGGGVSVVDLNSDGKDDVVFAPESGFVYAYLNGYPSWQRVSLFEVPAAVKQCLFADYDNDGDQDVAVSFLNYPLRIYRNEGNLVFVDASSLIDPSILFIQSIFGITWGDYDHDGWLDLYCSSYSYHPEAYSFLLHNDQGTFFSDYSYLMNLPSTGRLVTQSVMVDLNNDGRLDIWEANDRSPQDRIFIRSEESWFQYSPEPSSQYDLCSMSLSPYDFDLDGDLDVFVSNDPAGNRMFVQSELGIEGCAQCPSYNERASQLGLSMNKMCWGATWIDWNNDMSIDLFVSTAETLPIETTDEMLLQSETGFYNSNPSWANESPLKTYSAARGDLNGDHKEDLVLSHAGNTENEMVINPNDAGNWFSILLAGTTSNRDAIGSKVSVFVGEKEYSKWLMCGEDYLSQHSREMIFQLGDYEKIDSLIIQWPNGLKEYAWNIAANQRMNWVEGQGSRFFWPLSEMNICPNDSVQQPLPGVDFFWKDSSIANAYFQPTANDQLYGYFMYQDQPVWTDTIGVTFFAFSGYSIVPEHPSCHGSTDGSASIVINDENAWLNYQWIISGLPVLSNMPSGTYEFVLQSSELCVLEGNYELVDPPSLECDYFLEDSMLLLSASGGVGDYSFFLNNQLQNSNTILLSESGTYNYAISDENGCVCSGIADIVLPTFVEELGIFYWEKKSSGIADIVLPTFVEELGIFYWEKKSATQWHFSNGTIECTVLDANGRMLLPWARRGAIDMQTWSSGRYWIQYALGDQDIRTQSVFR